MGNIRYSSYSTELLVLPVLDSLLLYLLSQFTFTYFMS